MLTAVDVLLAIGEFSKMTHLSVGALRHYHDVGLLEPALIDPATGYRRYAASQVGTAQAIRRFRDLDMPIDEVRKVLHAPDLAARNRAILVHLERMHAQLEQTQATVETLHALLADDPLPHAHVEIRRIPATRVVVAREIVVFDDCDAWLEPTLVDLHAVAAAAGLTVDGADGALYAGEFFESGAGEVTAFVPVTGDAAEVVDLPATTVAVLLHEGTFADPRSGLRSPRGRRRRARHRRARPDPRALPHPDQHRGLLARHHRSYHVNQSSPTLASISFDCTDMLAAARFWSAVLGRPVPADATSE